MKNNIDISIVILNYNRANFLDRSLRSCLEQFLLGLKQLEIIIVDDSSNDDSQSFLNNYKNKVKIIRNKNNMGAGYSSNLAVKIAKGKYFMRVDSDDFISKLSCEIMSSILDNNTELAFVYADHIRVDKNGLREKYVKLNNRKIIKEHGAGIMFRTDCIKSVGNYNRNMRQAEDHDLIKRLNRKYKSFYLPIPLYRYYIHSNNLSLKNERKKILKKFSKNES
jgi:glycosyltransferase involved in cell wall biosynthesis